MPMSPEEEKKQGMQTIKEASDAYKQLLKRADSSEKKYVTPNRMRLLSAFCIAIEAMETAFYIHHGLTTPSRTTSLTKAMDFINFVEKTLPKDQGVKILMKKERVPGAGYNELIYQGMESSDTLDLNAPGSDYTSLIVMGDQPVKEEISASDPKDMEDHIVYHKELYECAKGIENAICDKNAAIVDAYKKVIEAGKTMLETKVPERPMEEATVVKEGEKFNQLREEDRQFRMRHPNNDWSEIPPTTPTGPQEPPTQDPANPGNGGNGGIPPTTPVNGPTDPNNHDNITPNPQVGPSPGENPTNKPNTPNNPGGEPNPEPSPEPGPAPAPPANDNQVSGGDNDMHIASVEALGTGGAGPDDYRAGSEKINAVCANILGHARDLLRKTIAGGQQGTGGAPANAPAPYHINIDNLRSIPARAGSHENGMDSLQKAFFALLDASPELKQTYKRVGTTDYDLSNIFAVMQVYGFYKNGEQPLYSGDLVYFANPDEYGGGCWAVLIGVKDRTISEALICHDTSEGFSITNTYLNKDAYMGEIVKAWSPAPVRIFSNQPQLNAFWGPALMRYRAFLDAGSLYPRDLYEVLFKDTKYSIGSYEELATTFGTELQTLPPDAKVMPGCLVFNEDDGVAVVLRNEKVKGRMNENNFSSFVNVYDWKDFKAKTVWVPHL